MAIAYENAVFDLEPHRTQWGHLPLVVVPFPAAFALVVLLKLVEGRIPEEISTAILGAVGVAYAAFVLGLPRVWRRWKARGRRELRVHRGEARAVDPTTGSHLGRCPIDAEPGRSPPYFASPLRSR